SLPTFSAGRSYSNTKFNGNFLFDKHLLMLGSNISNESTGIKIPCEITYEKTAVGKIGQSVLKKGVIVCFKPYFSPRTVLSPRAEELSIVCKLFGMGQPFFMAGPCRPR